MAEIFNPQNPEIMELSRQRKLAEMLVARGMDMPQGQTVAGGIYVPPSPLKYLANLYSTYAGNKANQELDTKEIALANRLRADETSAMADFMQERQGRPGVEGGIYGPNNQLTTETTADMYGPDMALNPQYRQVAPVAATPPNIQTALANLYANPKSSPRLQNMAFNKLIADPEGYTLPEGAKRFMTMPDGSVKEVASGGKKPRAPLQIDTGTAIELRDPENPTIVLQRIPKSQMPNAGQVVETANGLNGTPDKRGRVAVGAIASVPPVGIGLDPAVNPAFAGNPNYALSGTAGANTIVLIPSQLPAHSHNALGTATVTLNDPGHSHYLGNTPEGWASAGSIGIVNRSPFNVQTTTATTGITVTSNAPNNVAITVDTTGNDGAHLNIQPVIAAYYIMYIP